MQATKWIIVAVFAFCALQSDGAEIPRSADKIDLRIFVENGAAIAKNLFKAINAGLDASKPNADKILNELAPEAKAFIRRIIDGARITLKKEEKRVDEIAVVLTKALDALKPIKPCLDKISPRAKKLALATEKELVKIVLDVEKKYKSEIDSVKIGVNKTVEKARTLFDVEVNAVVKCLSPGRKDAYDCLTKEGNKVLDGMADIAIDAVLLFQTASDSLSPALEEVLQKLFPLLDKTLGNAKVLIVELADCVGRLK